MTPILDLGQVPPIGGPDQFPAPVEINANRGQQPVPEALAGPMGTGVPPANEIDALAAKYGAVDAKPVDYEALAAKHGAVDAGPKPVDLEALATKYGATDAAPAPIAKPNAPGPWASGYVAPPHTKPLPVGVLPTPTQGKEIAPSSYQIGLPPEPQKGPLLMSTERTPLAKVAPALATTTEPSYQEARQMAAKQVSDAVDENLPFLVGPFRIQAGIIKSGAQAVTDPTSLAIIAGTAGLGAVPGLAARALETGLSAYFATQAGKSFLQRAPEVAQKVRDGDYQGAAESGGMALADAVMAYGAASHATGNIAAAGRTVAPGISDLMDQLDQKLAGQPEPDKIRRLMDLAQRPGTPEEGEVAKTMLHRMGVDPVTGQRFGNPASQISMYSQPGEGDTGTVFPRPSDAVVSSPNRGGQIEGEATPAPEPEPQPVANTPEFIKAHNAWNASTLKAATKFMEEHPGTSLDEAKVAVAGTVGIEPQIGDFKPPPAPPPPPPEPPPAPEPVEPSKVDRVSPATPNPPTAAIPTQPESPQTIALQMQQLSAGQRRVVMFPQGQGIPSLASFPPGVAVHSDGLGNVYAYRPDLIKKSEISNAAKDNKLPEILGGPGGMGAPDKADLQGPPVAVVGRAPDGTEAQTTVTDQPSLPHTVIATHAVTPEGGTIEIKPPEEALQDRQGAGAPAKGVIQPAVAAPQAQPIVPAPNIPPEPQQARLPEQTAPAVPPPMAGTPTPQVPNTPGTKYILPTFATGRRKLPAMSVREMASAAKDRGLDVSKFDLKTPEGRRSLQEAIHQTPPNKYSDKSVRDFPVTATRTGDKVNVVTRLAGKVISNIDFPVAEWPKSKFSGYNGAGEWKVYDNPLYHQRQLVRKKMADAGVADFNAEGADNAENIADAHVRSINKVLGNDQHGNPPAPVKEPNANASNQNVEPGQAPSEVAGGANVSVGDGQAARVPGVPAGTGTGAAGAAERNPISQSANPGETAGGTPETGTRRVTGSADIPLSPGGEKQVEGMAEKKEVAPFTAVIHPDSERATETANAFSGGKLKRNSFHGWSRGIYEGQPADAVKAEMAHLITHPDEIPPGLSPISGKPGQSWNQMAFPMFADIDRLQKAIQPDERFLVVTSGGNLQAIDAWGKAGYPENFEFDHTAIAAAPYWSVTGKMFELGAHGAGLVEVKNNAKPGQIYLIEHGETAFNNKGEAGAAAPAPANPPAATDQRSAIIAAAKKKLAEKMAAAKPPAAPPTLTPVQSDILKRMGGRGWLSSEDMLYILSDAGEEGQAGYDKANQEFAQLIRRGYVDRQSRNGEDVFKRATATEAPVSIPEQFAKAVDVSGKTNAEIDKIADVLGIRPASVTRSCGVTTITLPVGAASPQNALAKEAAAAAQAMRDRMAAKKRNTLQRPRDLDPDDLTDLTVLGAEKMLGGATNFPAWARQVNGSLGDLIQFAAENANTTADDVLRTIYDYASEVAREYGVEAAPLPEREINGSSGEPDNRALESELSTSNPAPGAAGITFGGSTGGGEPSGGGPGAVRGEGSPLSPGSGVGGPGVGNAPSITPADVSASNDKGETVVETEHSPKDPAVVGTRHEHDYRIPDNRIISGSPERRAANNIEVLKLLKTLDAEGRPATVDEQHVLARYVGWGGAKQLFTEKPEWAEAQAAVRSLLSPEEYEAAANSTMNAHYTSDDVVDGMWHALRRLGVTAGMSWLEPSVGVGTFFGRQPADLLEGTRRIGIDKDPTTAKIAKYLYPDSGVDNSPFEQADLPSDYFDFAASNVPFGNYPVFDPEFRRQPFLTESIHNYFFAKSLNVVRPGGIVAFITSRYSMDGHGASATAFRRWISSNADLVGAIRLPNGAFKQAANTAVITDIIFLRRRLPDEPAAGEAWLDTVRKPLYSPRTGTYAHPVNEYFESHPEMVLGEQGLQRGEFTDHDYDVKGTLTPEILRAAIDRLPENQMREWSGGKIKKGIALRDIEADTTGKVGALFFDKNGNLFRKTSRGEALPQSDASELAKSRIRGQLNLRDIYNALTNGEREGADPATVEQMRGLLNEAYDNYVKQHGLLSSRENQKVMLGYPDAPLLPGLERDYDQGSKKDKREPSAKKAPVFSKRLFGVTEEVAPKDAKEALSQTLNHRGFLDWDHLKELTGHDDQQLRSDLAGLVYQDPESKQWQTADEYLSGSVRTKLRAARAIAKIDPTFEPNVAALEAAQPEDVPPSRIRAMLGVTWVPLQVYADFIQHMLGLRETPKVAHIGNEWTIPDLERNLPKTKWDTARVGAAKLIDAALNLRRIKVYDRGENGSPVINREATLAASQRQQEINDYFEKWLFTDPVRGDALVRVYNDLQNDLRLRQFDGSHLTLPGMSRAGLRTGNLEPYQLGAVWRMIVQRNVLLNHAPGAGKTFEMIAAGMELKRLGLVRRPMYVVPNSTLGGWQDQFATLYPSARVLVFSEADLAKDKRRAAVARMATGDWDAVVVPHSSFQFIPVGDEVFQDHYNQLEKELTQSIMEAKDAGLDTRMVTRLEKAKERLLTGLQKRRNAAKQDNLFTWEQLGIDQMFVDESHEFKKLGFATKQSGVAGIDQQGNQKTFDLRMKVRYTQSHGRGVVFASGTPVTNTMGEAHSIMRYLIEPEIEARGIAKFDDWAAEFGRIKDSFEAKPEGGGYQLKARFSRFVNLPRLATLLRSFSDVMTSDMLDIPRPKLAGGERQVVISEMNPDQEAFQKKLQGRAADIRRNPREALPDGMLVVFGDGGKMAMDARMVDPDAGDDPKGRLSQAADKIHYFWKQSAETKGTQLVFSDLGVPSEGKAKTKVSKSGKPSPGAKTDFSPYDELIRKLVERGIPRNEIAYIGQAKNRQQRREIFRRVNQGDIRVLLGSSQKMGVGVNVQERGYALHHLDVPARPDILDQREARFIRQGNIHPEVHVLYYSTKGTLDENKFGNVVRKGKFIDSLWKGDFTQEEADDLSDGVPSWELFQALTSGDPRVLRKLEVDNEVQRLSSLQWAFQDQMYSFRRRLVQAREEVERLRGRRMYLTQAKDARDASGRTWVIGDQAFSGDGLSEKVGQALIDAATGKVSDGAQIGTGHGLEVKVSKRDFGGKSHPSVEIWQGPVRIASEDLDPWIISKKELEENRAFNKANQGSAIWHSPRPEEALKPASLTTRLENDIKGIDGMIGAGNAAMERNEDEIAMISKDTDQEWPYQSQYQKLLDEQKQLDKDLGLTKDDEAAAAMEDGEEIADDSVVAEPEDGDSLDEEDEESDNPGVLARPRGDLIDDADAPDGSKIDATYENLLDGHGHVYVNRTAMDFVAQSLGLSGSSWGLTMDEPTAKEFLEGLREIQANPAFGNVPISKIADAVQLAIADDPVVTIVEAGAGVPVSEIRTTRREEAFHRAQMRLGQAGHGGRINTALLSKPAVASALDAMYRRNGRAHNNRAYDSIQTALVELGAMLGTEQGGELGLTPEQSAATLKQYFDALIDAHGPDAGTLLKYVAPRMRQALGADYVKARWNGKPVVADAGAKISARRSEASPPDRSTRSVGNGTESGKLRRPAEEPPKGVTLGSGLGALQPGLEDLYKHGIKPAAKSLAEFTKEAADEIQRVLMPHTRGADARYGYNLLREMNAEIDQRRDVAHAALGGFRQWFKNNTPKTGGFYGLDVYDDAETGNTANLSGPARDFADAAHAAFQAREQELEDLGLVKTFVDNYLPHIYAKPDEAEKVNAAFTAKRPMAGSESFRKQRKYMTLKEGLESGLAPKYDNPVDMVLAKLAEMDKSILAHQAFREMDEADKLHYVPNGGVGTRPPEGLDWIKDPIFQAHGPRFGVVGLPEEANIDPNDVRVFGRRIMGAWAAPKILADVVNNHLEPGTEGNIYKAYRGVNNTLNLLELGLSYFHGMTTTLNSAYSDIALGLQQAIEGTYKGGKKEPVGKSLAKAATSIGRGITPFASVITDVFGPGKKLIYAWDHWDAKRGEGKIAVQTKAGPVYVDDPISWAILDAMKAGGGSPRQDSYYATKYVERMVDGVSEILHGTMAENAPGRVKAALVGGVAGGILAGAPGAAIGAGVGAITGKAGLNAPGALLEYSMRPIMDYMVPRAKVAAFAKLMMEEINRNPDMSRTELRDTAGRLWDSMDDRFGQLRQKNMMMSASAKKAINAVVGRFGWQAGSIRTLGMGATYDLAKTAGDVINNLRQVGNGETPRLSKRTYYILGLLLGHFALSAIMTYLLTRKTPQGFDYIDPETGGFTETGHPARLIMPDYVSKDIQSYATNPRRTIIAKLAPELTIAAQLAMNRDFYDHKIYGEGGEGLREFATTFLYPYSVQAITKNIERNASPAKTLLPMIGLNPAGNSVGLSRAERMVADYMEEQGRNTRPLPTMHSRAQSQVYQAARRGDEKAAADLGTKAIMAGNMTPQQVQASEKRARLGPLASDYKNVADFKTAMRIYAAATDDERKVLAPEARAKVYRAQRAPYEWNDSDGHPDKEVRSIVQRYFPNFRPYTPAQSPQRQVVSPSAIQ